MFHMSRRRFVVSAAAASAAFGLDKRMEFLPPAQAQGAGAWPGPAPLLEKGFVKFKVGNVEVTQLYDGVWEKAHDENFIKGANVEQTKAALKASGINDANVPIPFTVTVVNMGGGRIVMFDSGTGAQMTPTSGYIVKKDLLKAAGIDPAKINAIVITHFHPDHIFGLMAKDTNAETFANTQILTPDAEYKFWTDSGVLTKLPEARHGLAKRIQATFPKWKNIKQFEVGKDVVPGIRSVATPGHTPGHTSYLIGSGGNQLMVLGDVANVPALFVKHPNWQAQFDQDPQMAEANRRKTFDRVVADKITVTGYHFGMPGAGTIAKDGNGYVFTPTKV